MLISVANLDLKPLDDEFELLKQLTIDMGSTSNKWSPKSFVDVTSFTGLDHMNSLR